MAKKKKLKRMSDICREVFDSKGTDESAIKLAVKKMIAEGHKEDNAQRAAMNVIRACYASKSKKKTASKKVASKKKTTSKKSTKKEKKKSASKKEKKVSNESEKKKSSEKKGKKITDGDLDDF
ncbi:unnamed protein product [marine sediment metagenome]|uniref:Uncharacterized protein n=1 Tax=marine sediment metagenome TaxID=412755 RepID=X0TIU2_9ZZZZ